MLVDPTDNSPIAWDEKPFAQLPDRYLLRLAQSNLTSREKAVVLVVLVRTRGESGTTYHVFGRNEERLSTREVANLTGMSERTAKDVVKSLIRKGWLTVTCPAVGRRARTIAPNPNPPRGPLPAETEPAEPSVLSLEDGLELLRQRREKVDRERKAASIRRARGEA